jgi:RHS repeat-associated protein
MQDGPGYTGHVSDAATGLVYMQQRYYDPVIARFLSVDPVTAYDTGDMRHFSRYAYAFNNPYKFTDPDGRQSAADRFSDSYGSWTTEERAPFEAVAVPVAIAVVALTPVVGPELALGARAYLRSSERPTVAGVRVGKTPSETRAALEKAGHEGKPISNPSETETGTLHNVPGMKMDVRVMNGGPKHEPRVVTTVQGTRQPVNPTDGKNFGNIPKAQQLEKSHIPLKPDKVQ